MTFRYLSDFSVALNGMFISLILSVVFYLNSFFKKKFIFILLFIFLIELCYVSNERFFDFNNQIFRGKVKDECTDKRGVKKLVAKFNRDILLRPYLPEVSYCRQTYSTAGLKFQYFGWNIHGDCLVSVSTSAILPSRRCITLNYTVQDIQQIPNVQVKRDFSFLKLIDSQVNIEKTKESSQERMTQLFCSDATITDSIALYTIGWVTPEEFDKIRNATTHIKLNWLSVAKQCLNNK